MTKTNSWLQNKYIYRGPVFDRFDSMIETEWYGETTATSKAKAISNLRWKYCRETDRFPYLNVGFDESLIKEEVNPFKYSERKKEFESYPYLGLEETVEQLRLF